MLVALRLCIGWHFFKEGAAKHREPDRFTAAGFFRQARGPLAERLHTMADDGHRWSELLAAPRSDARQPTEEAAGQSDEATEAPPYKQWQDQILEDWRSFLTRYIDAADLTEEQKEAAAEVYAFHAERLGTYLEEQRDDIATYRHELHRLGRWKNEPTAGELPYQGERINQKEAEVQAMPGTWVAAVRDMRQDYHRDLWELLDHEQRVPVADVMYPVSPLNVIDKVVPYWLLAVGACLLLGLFTRVAAVAGVAFLVGVVATQPPWAPGADSTYYQWVELVALLMLATTAVGRWGGLDFFIHALWSKCCGKRESTG